MSKNERLADIVSADHTPDQVLPPPPAPRRVGRPKGLAKNPASGRKKDIEAWTSERVREKALPEALETLLAICRGDALLCDDGLRGSRDKQSGPGAWRRPSLQDRLKADQVLLNKSLPDARSVDMVVDQTVRTEQQQVDNRTMARAILSILSKAGEDAGKIPSDDPGGPIDATLVHEEAFAISAEKNSGNL